MIARRIGLPRCRVSMTDRTLAYRVAPHSERKQLVTLRKTTQGRSACSEPLLVAGMSRLVTKTNRFWQQRLMTRSSFWPALVAGASVSRSSRRALETGMIGATHLALWEPCDR